MNLVEIDGKRYIERMQVFPFEVTMTSNGTFLLTQQQITLPGIAPFWLKALTRDTIVAGASVVRRFRFRLGNSDGGLWYTSAGNGGTTDRVIDALIFGNGPFPYVVYPHIVYGRNAAIRFELEDVSNQGATYVLALAFHGSYLIEQS